MAELDFYIHVKSNADGTAAECTMIPSTDVAPVRHGKWSMKFMDDRHSHFYGLFRFTCSACGYYEDKDYSDSMDDVNYCPNCGADMRPTQMSGTKEEDGDV